MTSQGKKGRGRPLSKTGEFHREHPLLPKHLHVTNELVELYESNIAELPKVWAEIQRHVNPGEIYNIEQKRRRAERINATWGELQRYGTVGDELAASFLAAQWHKRWQQRNTTVPPSLVACSCRMLAEYIREARKIYGPTCT